MMTKLYESKNIEELTEEQNKIIRICLNFAK